MNCIWCGSPTLRPSRIRLSDLGRIFLLQFPIRCRTCDGRYFAGPLSAWRLRAAAKARRMERERRNVAPAK